MTYNETLLFEEIEIYTDSNTSDIELYNNMYNDIALEEQY